MARTKRDARIEHRSNRAKLTVSREPYWTKLEPGRALGYRKTTAGAGTWIARIYLPESKTAKRYKSLATADDLNEADGLHILSYAQAQAEARKWFEEQLRFIALELDGELPRLGPYKVSDAMAAYLDDARHRGMKGLANTQSNIRAHILPKLGDLDVSRLTRPRIQKWHLELSETPRRRGGRGEKGAQLLAPPKTPDERRARRDTANRILAALKAGLNYAHRHVTQFSSTPWRDVSPFREVTSCRVRFLSVEEQRALVAACPKGFKELVMAALFTGCRFGELARLRVRDFDPTSSTLLIEISKSGKPRRVWVRPEAKVWFQRLVEGKAGDQPMLIKLKAGTGGPRGPKEDLSWLAHDQKKLMDTACAQAGVERLTFHELRHTYASTLIKARVPLYVVAKQLGHGDTRMVERYYGHLAPSDVAAVISELAPDLNLTAEENIRPLASASA